MASKKDGPKTKTKTNKLCAEGHTCFFCCNGEVFSSVKELHKALKTMDDETFAHHCNEQRCDFAAWIRDVFGKKRVAGRIEKARASRKEVTALIKELL